MKPTMMALLTLLVCSPASAQWLKQPTTGIPRSSDGKPNLSAAAPRTADGHPDLSGIWTTGVGVGYMANIAGDLEARDILPWADQLFIQRMGDLGKDDPGSIGCLPLGPRHITTTSTGLVKIIQTPTVIVLLFEDLAYRQIFLDGRTLPVDPNPSFMGYSVGRWEGDELIVDSAGFNDRTWLDYGGHPHTESLLITERYRRRDFGHIERRITVTDPKAFTKTITIPSQMALLPDTELIEYVCAENTTDRAHLVGRTSDERKIAISLAILNKYAGTYEFVGNGLQGTKRLNVSVAGDRMFVDFDGKGRVPMIPLSETMFSPRLGGTYRFVVDASGTVTHVSIQAAETSFTAVRLNH